MAQTLDTEDLAERVRRVYRAVATSPDADFHFETGRALAERLGYPPTDLDAIPAGAIDSYAGVGYFLDLAAIRPGETVVDLGSGSGMDSFLAARRAGRDGRVIGADMTDDQLAKAQRLAVASTRISVVLPAPFGPSSPYTTPAGTRSDSPSSALTPPRKALRSESTAMIGSSTTSLHTC